ncbi:unnamed protein product [Euphydryas editha]|uniref:Uncharacterized protein n=1 Tax=Euphydryas editha TaxID=104508 RepID=A0AAU9UD08_EUPED|nr:unnamed protein product [Euphydryas editha]
MSNILFYISVREVEASLLQADLSKQLSEIGRSINHVLKVRERCLPSELEHREFRRVQQTDRASERHQLSGTEEQVFAFDFNCVHLPSKNNLRNEKRVKEMCFLPTIYENVTWSYSECFEKDNDRGLSYPSDVEVDECQMQQHTAFIDEDKYVNCNSCNLRALFYSLLNVDGSFENINRLNYNEINC